MAKIGERLCAKLGKDADSDKVVDAKQYFGKTGDRPGFIVYPVSSFNVNYLSLPMIVLFRGRIRKYFIMNRLCKYYNFVSYYVSIITWVFLRFPARFTHDFIALVASGIDVDSISATEERSCPSFRAMESILSTLDSLLLNAMKMWECRLVLPGVSRL